MAEWWAYPLWAMTIIYIISAVIGTALTIKRRKHPPLNARMITLTLMTCIFGIFLSVPFTLQMTHPELVDCDVVLAFGILMLPFVVVPYYISSFRVIFNYWWNVHKMSQSVTWHHKYKWVVSYKYLYSALGVVMFLHILAAIISELTGIIPDRINPIFTCTVKHNISISVFGMTYFFGLSIAMLKLFFINDIYLITKELMVCLFLIGPYFPLWMFAVFNFIPIHPSIFPLIAACKSLVVTIHFPLYLTYTEFWSNYKPVNQVRLSQISWSPGEMIDMVDARVSQENGQTDRSSQNPLTAEDSITEWQLIEKPEYFENIKHFSVQAWCVELLMFYSQIKELRKKSDQEVRGDVEHIYQQYIPENSPLELDISEATKTEIEEQIKGGNLNISVFDRAFDEVCYMIKKNLFPPWKRSNLYQELIKSTQT